MSWSLFDYLLVDAIDGDALVMFINRDKTYVGKGFKKLVRLQLEYASISEREIAMELFDSFKRYEQSSKTPNNYEVDLQ